MDTNEVKEAFANKNLKVFTNQSELIKYLKSINLRNNNVLFMSSGNFSGLELGEFATQLITK